MQTVEESAARVRARCSLVPELGLVLGSGLGFLGDQVEAATVVPYGELPGLPVSTVPGHAGRLVLGRLSGRPVVVMQGRFHFYEGYGLAQVTSGVRLLARLGVRGLLITNAAGGVRADLHPGDLMLINDHINLMGSNPLIGRNLDALGPRFPDMSDAYTRALRAQARAVAAELGIPIKEGVYAAFTGPSYETPAEIRALRTLGADAVGMSTIPEVIAACHMGVPVLGMSCISNLAAGISDKPLSHAEVTETAERVKAVFSRLVLGLVAKLELPPRPGTGAAR
ncbi:MAG TPA: purine-nucleoside phosphorylase [Myxococcota bacterium]|nr:purine-nucleoside phosphorylase [Myxococcota bacterium]HRY94360.1 purine-nucleoside phosphorylase [Myxococcota bacterium]